MHEFFVLPVVVRCPRCAAGSSFNALGRPYASRMVDGKSQRLRDFAWNTAVDGYTKSVMV
jgi:hypothetical protein